MLGLTFLITKLPTESLITARLVPYSDTLAKGTGSRVVLLMIFPFRRCFCCAFALMQRHTINRSESILFIKLSFSSIHLNNKCNLNLLLFNHFYLLLLDNGLTNRTNKSNNK